MDCIGSYFQLRVSRGTVEKGYIVFGVLITLRFYYSIYRILLLLYELRNDKTISYDVTVRRIKYLPKGKRPHVHLYSDGGFVCAIPLEYWEADKIEIEGRTCRLTKTKRTKVNTLLEVYKTHGEHNRVQ